MNLPVKVIAERGYRYIPAVFQYSSGITALPGFKLHRIRFARLMPMIEGFRWIENYLTNIGRPLTAFAACELRSALPFSQDGFKAFNTVYADTRRCDRSRRIPDELDLASGGECRLRCSKNPLPTQALAWRSPNSRERLPRLRPGMTRRRS
jgi:hypothetical protein